VNFTGVSRIHLVRDNKDRYRSRNGCLPIRDPVELVGSPLSGPRF
jgi:hypothetical protein